MKYRKVKLDEIEVPNGIKSQLMEESADIFLVSRDDDTPVLIFGVYTASVIAMWRLVWMITYPAFRPIDFRGAAKLFAQVRKYTPTCARLCATINLTPFALYSTWAGCASTTGTMKKDSSNGGLRRNWNYHLGGRFSHYRHCLYAKRLRLQAAIYQMNAEIATDNAHRAIQRAQVQQEDQDVMTQALLGQQLSEQSASGVSVGFRFTRQGPHCRPRAWSP